jgi:hypothetical protein
LIGNVFYHRLTGLQTVSNQSNRKPVYILPYSKNSIFAIKPPLPLEMKKPLYRDKANNQKKHQLQTDR